MESRSPDEDTRISYKDNSLSVHLFPNDRGSVLHKDLLEHAKSLWLISDWDELINLLSGDMKNNKDRAKLSLILAVAYLNRGELEQGKMAIKAARAWGVEKQIVARALIGCALNSQARISLAKGESDIAAQWIRSAHALLSTFPPKNICEYILVKESARLGLFGGALDNIEKQLTDESSTNFAKLDIIKSEIEVLRHELSLAQRRGQLYSLDSSAEDCAYPNFNAWKNKSFSQLGQDIWVLEKTNNKRNGFFVEFGATDGVMLSNTYLLEYEMAWEGLCAEPNPKFFSRLKGNRKCKVFQDYIGKDTGTVVKFILADVYSTSEEFLNSDHHASKRHSYEEMGEVIVITSISLNDFLKNNGAPKSIDYISIDTEGSEFQILSNFSFSEWRVKLFTIEHNYSPQREEIAQLMAKNGYVRTEKEWDDWYELIE